MVQRIMVGAPDLAQLVESVFRSEEVVVRSGEWRHIMIRIFENESDIKWRSKGDGTLCEFID